jgi:23S rRNA (guanine2445-N2)-methyltransferase / 23S rRNA (guanine2069-N7)-methyltransferase
LRNSCNVSPDVRDFFASCPKGLEYLLVDELKAIGASDVREALAGVYFHGGLDIGYRACLWSRLASRIFMPIVDFPVEDGDQLYEGAKAIAWSEHLPDGNTFAIDTVGSTPGVTHTQYAGLRVKDAIVDQYREATGERPDIDTQNPDLRINLALRKGKAIVSIDLSGAPLHQRGYRAGTGLAPLKENLAAAMLLRAGWPAIYAAGGGLVDPMCGSGTLVIEAALMAADVAPGLRRERFGFEGWKGYDAALWKTQHDEAQTPGLVICNPPYGERFDLYENLDGLYRLLGEKLKAEFSGWRASMITSDDALARAVGLHAEKKYKLYNGALECTLYNYDLTPRTETREVKPLSAGGQMVKNRIDKNFRHLHKRASREDIECWRVYDADLPEYAAAIDIYADCLHIQEYQAPSSVDENLARTRLRELTRAAGEVLEIPRERVAVKTRARGKGGEKYGRLDERHEFMQVREGGLTFEVNLWDYLDTGLFLDHRPLRARVCSLAKGKRFLNLFCYTASVSVYAAAGGALETTSVDLSATYLEWASRNLALNDFMDEQQHKLVREDATAYLHNRSAMYDLIFVDPPTFSNSKRAEDFDVQRDHAALLNLCGERLLPGGLILFSNNFRRFKLDEAALEKFAIKEITRETIPFDFERNARIHRAWELRHR